MKLSIIVPVFNVEKSIERCLDSIARQTFKDFELIIVDDGSTDNSSELIKSFLENKYISYKYLYQDNLGASKAREKGLDIAEGDYIGFVDGDDWIEEDYYEKLMDKATTTSSDIVCCGVTHEFNGRVINNDSGCYDKVLTNDEARLLLLERKGIYPYLVNKVYKKRLFDYISFPDNKMIGEDFIINMKVLDHAKTVYVIKDRGYHYEQSDLSTSKKGYSIEHLNMYEEFMNIYQRCDNSEYKSALERYMVLHFMAILVSMVRNKQYDELLIEKILSFVRKHRSNYLNGSNDGLKTKIAVILATVNFPLFKLITGIVL